MAVKFIINFTKFIKLMAKVGFNFALKAITTIIIFTISSRK